MTKRNRLTIVAVAAAVVLGTWVVTRLWQAEETHGIFASGTVEATDAQLGFQVPGRIDFVAVREGDGVKKDQELARLDTTETEARLVQAKAQVAATTVRLRDARRDLARNKALLAGGAIGQEAYDKSLVNFDVARSEHTRAQASVREIEAMLANMVIRASFDGVVTVRHHEPGEIVAAGAPVLTVMNPNDRWVRIYIPENRIGAVHLGQKAAITTDTYPERRYGGTATFIASEAEFTPKNVQTTEERVKLVYAVKVRITHDPQFDLKPGVPADVRFEGRQP